MNAQSTQLSARMFEMREQARAVFGTRYEGKVQSWKMILVAVAKRRACGVLDAAMHIADPKEQRATCLRDFDVLLLTAAAVELIEGPMPRSKAAGVEYRPIS